MNLKPRLPALSTLTLFALVAGPLCLRCQSNPVPIVNQPLIPAGAVPGAAAFTLTVNGTGFTQNAVIQWNGQALTTTYVNSRQLTAGVPATDVATAGTATVAVANPGPGGGSSNTIYFPVADPRSTIEFNRTDFPVGNTPTRITAADLNSDGALDLIMSNSGDNTISVLLGDGHGFFSRTDYPTGVTPGTVAVGDFNSDGALDLAVANSGCAITAVFCDNPQGTIRVFLGNGDGTFKAGVDYIAGIWTTSVLVGDLDGDGNLDLVSIDGTCPGEPCSTSTSTVSVFLGKGDGTFGTPTQYTVGLRPVAGVIGDFDGDGIPDIAVVNDFDYTVSVLLGAGNGVFQPRKTYPTGINGIRPTDVVAADFNHDGILDLAVTNEGSIENQAGGSSVTVLIGNSDGSFQKPVEYPSDVAPQSIAATDLNGDGLLDLAVTCPDSNTVSVYLGMSDGTFQPRLTFPTLQSPIGIVAADLNGDGQLDLAVVEQGSGALDATVSTFIQPALEQTPALVALPSASRVTVQEPLSVAITVSGTSGGPKPTGTVLLSGAGLSVAPAVLSSGTATIQIPAGALRIGSDTLAVLYTPDIASSSLFNDAAGTVTVTVTRVSQSVTFPAIPNQVALTDVVLSATATSGLAVRFASDTPAVCTVSGARAHMRTAGICTIQASQPGNQIFAPAPVIRQNIRVRRSSQTILFNPVRPQIAGTKITLAATATSDLKVSFESTTPKVCTVSGVSAHLLAAGSCNIVASQPGNSIYGAAPAVSQRFTVQPRQE